MAWDTEATKRKLLDAGARQFAAHGFAGARMDAIGRDAAVNKERVYQYFGDKRGLYAAVLADQLDALLEGVEITGTGAGAIGGYAGRLFDRFQNGALAARLLAWESLELDQPAATEHRARLCAQSARAFQAAVPGLTPEAAAHLLLSIVTLVAGWWTLAHLAGVVLAGPVAAEERRAVVVRQATDLAAAADAARP